MRLKLLLLLLVTALAAFGCQSEKKTEEAPAPATESDVASGDEPDFISVQHILIAFKGSIPDPKVTRTMEEAEKLAADIFIRAKGGEDFDELVKEYTDDAYPGVYKMANFGVPADMSQKIFARDRMVKAFGDVGFPLEVGGIGLAQYNPQSSRYGWHIIKRVE
jgi:hypothetical protein